MDLPAEALAQAFGRAEFEFGRKDGMPLPKDLRALAGAGSVASSAADQAWVWVTNYIEKYGVEGHSRLTHISPGSYRYEQAPQIPEAITHALEAIGRGARGGLSRIDTTKAEHMGLLRADFDRAYARTSQGLALVVSR